MQPKPRITFLFPYRWIEDPEDKKFLDENLKRQLVRDWGAENIYELEGVPAYRAIIQVRALKMINIPITKAFIQKTFKEYFPIAKCLSLDIDFQQHKSKTILPTLKFEMYF